MTSPRLVACCTVAVAVVGMALALRPPALAAQAVPPPDTAPRAAADTAATKTAAEIPDSLLAAGDSEASYSVLVARLGVFPDDFEARWRATRAALGLGIMGADPDTRRHWLREADAHVALTA